MKHHSHQPELKIVSVEWVEAPDSKQRLARVFDILLRDPVPAAPDKGRMKPAPIRPMGRTKIEKKGGDKRDSQERL